MRRSDEELGPSSDVRLETTEYDRSLEQAGDAEERWRSLLENPFHFVYIVDREGVYQYVNRTPPGISREDLLGKATIYDHLATDYHPAARQVLDQVFSSATAAAFEAYLPPPVDLWFSIVVGPVRRDGDVVSASLLSRDITPRKTAEAARHESEERFHQLAESIDDVFYLLDPGRRRLLYLSPAYERIWGRPVANLEGNPRAWQEGIHPEDRKEVIGRMRTAIREYDRSMVPIEYRVVRPDGSVRWVRHRAFSVRDGSPTSHRIAGIITDVTEQRAFLEESRRARAFSLRLLEAQEAERSRLSSELHDEFGQSLTGLKLLLAAAGRSVGEHPSAELLQEATGVASDLLAKVHDRSLDLRPAILDDLGLLPALLALFRTFTRRTKIEVRFEHRALGDRFLPTMETTAYRVAQEALTNVARYAEVSEVKVRAWSDRRALHVRIEDAGGGFDVAAARSRAGGIVGLQERVRLQGGELHVESTLGRGSCLSVCLPIQQEEPEDPAEAGGDS
jgi:PAS domain S-box-containing protein